MKFENLNSFYSKRRVLVTGHTGFKGSWLCQILSELGADVLGYSLPPPTQPNLFDLLRLDNRIKHVEGDIRNCNFLRETVLDFQPQVIFHLAAQPLVRESYQDPRYTYETNVMGTVNILETLRMLDYEVSFVNVTTDKVYKNKEWEWGYREIEELDGYDPYSNSKSCSELVTNSYKNCFFSKSNKFVSTARAGNVIGGGDFSKDRILPDCLRACSNGEIIKIRNPNSTRPYQHVLEPLFFYLLLASKQVNSRSIVGSYNVGPEEADCVTTGELATMYCEAWGNGLTWQNISEQNAPHEANFLKLDCSKAKKALGWYPLWGIREAVKRTCDFNRVYLSGQDVLKEVNDQIRAYKQGGE